MDYLDFEKSINQMEIYYLFLIHLLNHFLILNLFVIILNLSLNLKYQKQNLVFDIEI